MEGYDFVGITRYSKKVSATMDLFSVAGLVLVLLALGWYYLIKPHRFWTDRGVPQTRPWTLLGDIWPVLLMKKSPGELLQYVYDLAPNSRYVGFYNFHNPVLMIRDPQLIKKVTIKDFNHFCDHPDLADPKFDLLWGRNLFALKGDSWREMRHIITPTFSSVKVKILYELLIAEQAENFVKYFKNNSEGDFQEVEVKDAFSRYTNDVIASTAFGISVNSLEDRNNEFFSVGYSISDMVGFLKGLKYIALRHFPFIANMLGFTFYGSYPGSYFTDVILDAIKMRKEKNIVRPDIIHLLMEASDKLSENNNNNNKKQTPISSMDIVSECIVFFIAGFQTVSTALSFTIYELALHQDIQSRLREEIKKHAVNGKVSYETLYDMPYLDMVVTESLRKWPVLPAVDRVCTKSYTIEPVNEGEKPLKLTEGQEVSFPIYALHRNPEYYPDPEKFDPERFSPENKSKIPDFVYHPFGCGPRICVGIRFALVEIKAIIFQLLLNFEIVPTPNTKPLILGRGKDIHLAIEGGKYWLGFKKIKN